MSRYQKKHNGRIFEYSQEHIDSRFTDHWTFAEDFVENILSDPNRKRKDAKLFISPRRLHMAIDSAYQDIARYKNYHQDKPHTEYLDCTKRCAYLAKWLIKFKPIQSMISSDDHSLENLRNRDIDELEIINELFVLYLFELHLSDEMKINLALSESKAFQLAYDLLYRQVNVDGWISIFQLIKDCCYPKFVKGVPFLDKI